MTTPTPPPGNDPRYPEGPPYPTDPSTASGAADHFDPPYPTGEAAPKPPADHGPPGPSTAPPAYPEAIDPPYPDRPSAAPTDPPAPPAPGRESHQSAPTPWPRPTDDLSPPGRPWHSTSPPGSRAPRAPEDRLGPDDLDYRHAGSRRMIGAFQRGADYTTVGRLLMHIPICLVSAALVTSLAIAQFADLGWAFTLIWIASGAFVFHRPTELLFARWFLKLRVPQPEERRRLEPIWDEVTARAGIEPGTYTLMIENSRGLNAFAAAGHIVGVTTHSLNTLPTSRLAAVLAHELGHHVGGHAWAGLLGQWYSLPARFAWFCARFMTLQVLSLALQLSLVVGVITLLAMGVLLIVGIVSMPLLTMPLIIAPWLLAFAERQSEFRADQQAAALGFGRELCDVLQHFQTEATEAARVAARRGQKPRSPGAMARLLSSHPDHAVRLRRLQGSVR